MAKYSVKFEVEVIVDEPFEIGEEGETLYDEIDGQKSCLTDSKWNDIVSDALSIMEIDGCNATHIERVEVMSKGKYELHIYWEDGVTIECRYFLTEKMAEKYAKDNGISNYRITKN